MIDIAANLAALRHAIAETALHYGRAPSSVALLAVSKTQPITAIRAALDAQQTAFGENYVQEALVKIPQLANTRAEWHFIGPIQSNKTQDIATHFDWVHSLDRWKVAERLNAHRLPTQAPLNVCLQVNISQEDSKSGLQPEALHELATRIRELPRLRLRGLMAIPAPETDFAKQRQVFARVRALQEQLIADGFDLDTLSMGMSGDWQAAVAEGATLIRIGTAIFGARARPDTITPQTPNGNAS